MRSSIGIDVDAPAALVFSIARDVERWAELLPHYVVADRRAAPDAGGRLLVGFVARRPLIRVLGLGLPVAWRSLTWSNAEDQTLHFAHRGGATNGMNVTWRIVARPGGGCRIDIEHDFRPRVPGWAGLVDRLFTAPIAARTLATFRAIAEAVAACDDRDESGDSAPTNSPG
ncbi:MAG TPA: SRPBCC family protein [Patescibacteria group bacterium]|nr:SRPBCC family protein [Patescibacteria group bacterium]